jgi:hypothetical protein
VSFVDALKPFADRKRARRDDVERCEICAAPIGERHPHVLQTDARKLLCSCPPCAQLFADESTSASRLRAVPDRVLFDVGSSFDEAAWTALGVPVGLVFVVHDSAQGRRDAFYPSPAGPVQSEVTGEAWAALASRAPLARHVRPDVEALLVRRGPDGTTTCFVAPIDECYALVGVLRAHWRGFDGGDDARRMLEGFLGRLRERATPVDASAGESP